MSLMGEFTRFKEEKVIGVTYFFYDKESGTVIAFFTVSNDAIRTDPFINSLPEDKRRDIGTQMMDFIKITDLHFIPKKI